MMKMLYFENENYALYQIGKVSNYSQAIEKIKILLGSQMYQINYCRVWAEKDKQIGWCLVIDYGSWSTFFKIGDFESEEEAIDFLKNL